LSTTEVFERGDYLIGVAKTFGPRVVSLRWRQGPELFAQLDPSLTLHHPDRPYVLHGGHRLWVAPEVPALTYAPDDAPCEISADGDGLVIEAAADTAGFAKRISIKPHNGGLDVEHRLTNAGPEPVQAAAWAITQVPLGGKATLPLGRRADADTYQADRRLVLWPYTELHDERISFDSDSAVVKATAGPRLKLGSGPAVDRLDYVRGTQRFTKTFDSAQGEQSWADLGAVAQVFCAQDCAELESLGPIVALEPGESTTHIECWSVQQD
jgi:hypothetical protein